MPYLPNYQHDIFISYAHIDNQNPRWVSSLRDDLIAQLQKRAGKDINIWMDDSLDSNHPITPEILRAIDRSALLLVILSKSYLASEWCNKERRNFLKLAEERVADGRLFVIHFLPTERENRPSEFRDLKGIQFWEQRKGSRSQNTLGWPDKSKSYWNRVFDLCADICRELDEIKAREQPEPNRAGPIRRVFVARSTEDLEEREDDLKSYLTQAGFATLPANWYPENDETAFRKAMAADLERSEVFVQLLSEFGGHRASFLGGKRYTVLQYQIAREAGKPILQWRDLRVDPMAVKDEEYRALVEAAQACGFTEFKDRVAEAARPKPPRAPQRSPDIKVAGLLNIGPSDASHSIGVFINADQEDLDVAKAVANELSRLLADKGVDCFLPIFAGNSEDLEKDLNDRLKECDGLVLVYGKSDPLWVREQFSRARKILSARQPFAARALYLGPPPHKPDTGLIAPDLIVLDGREGMREDLLRQFVQKLTAARVDNGSLTSI